MAQWLDSEWYPATVIKATTYKNGKLVLGLGFVRVRVRVRL